MSKSKAVDPIQEAVLRGDAEAVSQAIAAGAVLDKPDREGRSALFYAVRQGRPDLVVLLLDAGANADVHDRDGWTPLHFAAQVHNAATATALLEHGARVDAQDAHGNTPLFRAVFESKGRPELISLLLKAGARKDLRNKHDVSPEELADSIGNYDVASILRST